MARNRLFIRISSPVVASYNSLGCEFFLASFSGMELIRLQWELGLLHMEHLQEDTATLSSFSQTMVFVINVESYYT